MQAYDLYLRGKFLIEKRNKTDLLIARELFQQAVNKDKTFAIAYSGLANTYLLSSYRGYEDPDIMLLVAKKHIDMALGLDSSSGEIQATMSHPFGNLLSQHLHRQHGLSQARLAAGILQDPAIIAKMCKGQRLTGLQARERVVAIAGWLVATRARECTRAWKPTRPLPTTSSRRLASPFGMTVPSGYASVVRIASTAGSARRRVASAAAPVLRATTMRRGTKARGWAAGFS